MRLVSLQFVFYARTIEITIVPVLLISSKVINVVFVPKLSTYTYGEPSHFSNSYPNMRPYRIL
jgi:hypothetical protein